MSDISDSSAVDEKKKENEGNGSEKPPNYSTFFWTVFTTIGVFLCYFSISSYVLYACKIAQANILPTNVNCYPYTDQSSKPTKIDTNIFKTLFSDPQLSIKLSFPYNDTSGSIDENATYSLLGKLRNNKKTASVTGMFFINIIENLFEFNYSTIDTILNFLNQLPEILIILFGPFILSIITGVLFIGSWFYGVYLWLSNLPIFFKEGTKKGKLGADLSFYDTDYWVGIAQIIFFFIMLVVCIFSIIPIPIINSLIIFCVLVSIACYRGSIKGLNNKGIGLSYIISEVFKCYKIPIVLMLCVIIISLAFSYLGYVSGVVSVGLLIAFYFGLFKFDLFKSICDLNINIYTNVDTGTDKQAGRNDCEAPEKTESSGHGFLWKLLVGNIDEGTTGKGTTGNGTTGNGTTGNKEIEMTNITPTKSSSAQSSSSSEQPTTSSSETSSSSSASSSAQLETAKKGGSFIGGANIIKMLKKMKKK